MRMQDKNRVPPFNHLNKLLKLREEYLAWETKVEAMKKKRAADANAEGNEQDEEETKKYEALLSNTPKEWDVLKHYDFVQPLELKVKKPDEHQLDWIVEYNEKETSLYDIFQEYGTSYRPCEDKNKDPEPPKPKEKVDPPKKEPTPPKKVEDDEEALDMRSNIDEALKS